MKERIVVAFACFALMSSWAGQQEWRDPSTGITWHYELYDGNASICSANCDWWRGKLAIPAHLGCCPVTEIGERVFERCSKMTDVTIPSAVTKIGSHAFDGCSGLKGVTIPSGVVEIGSWAFNCCSGLQRVAIPAGVMTIGDHAFCGCDELTEVSVEELNEWFCSVDGVLYDKTMTTLILCPDGKSGTHTIPASVTSVKVDAFCQCRRLTAINVSGRNEYYCSVDGVLYDKDLKELISCPAGKTGVCTIPLGAMSVRSLAFYACAKLTGVKIPSGVTNIGERAFSGCSKLTTISIPESVTGIGSSAFRNCSRLKTIVVADKNEEYHSLDGVLYNKTMTELICCPAGKAGSCSIPSGVTRIADNAFSGCSGLTELIIPTSVSEIGAYAFCFCSGLTRLTIPARIVGKSAFEFCGGLTSVTFLPEVTEIGDWAFSGCDNLTRIIFRGIPPEWSVDYDTRDLAIRYPKEHEDDWEAFADGYGGLTDLKPFIGHEVVVGIPSRIDVGMDDCTRVVGLPKGLSFSAQGGLVTGTVKDEKSAGDYEVRLVRTDGESELLMLFVRPEEPPELSCEGLESGLTVGVANATEDMALSFKTESEVKSVSATGLPSGMKLVQDKSAKQWSVTGVPTKAGSYSVKITVTTAAKTKAVIPMAVEVAALPAGATGMFNGFSQTGDGCFHWGTFTMSVTESGKITAKIIGPSGTYSFAANGWNQESCGLYVASLATKKGDRLSVTLDATAEWDCDQLCGQFVSAGGAAYSVSAQRNAFGKTWYLTAEGNEADGWVLAYAENGKSAALAVSLNADGRTTISGKLGGLKVSASGFANVSEVSQGAIMADFSQVVTVKKSKKALSLSTNLWFDRSDGHAEGVGSARLVD